MAAAEDPVDDGMLVARFAPQEDTRGAAAALNRVLCTAGLRIHAFIPRRHSLETLYRQAAPAALA